MYTNPIKGNRLILNSIGVGTGGAGGGRRQPPPSQKCGGGREYPSAPPAFMAENPLFL